MNLHTPGPPDVILRIVEGLSDIGALNTNRDIAQIFANIFDKWAMQLTNEISADAHSSISARANESPSWPELLKMGATLTCDRIFPRCLQVVLEPLVEEFKARGMINNEMCDVSVTQCMMNVCVSKSV